MVLGLNKIASFRLNINSKIIPCSNAVKLLEILIRNKFKFKEHIEKLCKKASFDFHALRRIGGQLANRKANLLANAFIDSQFSFPSFTSLVSLQLDNKVQIDQKLLQLLALEVKSLMHLNPEFIWGFILIQILFGMAMRKGTKTFLPPIKSICSVPFRESFFWNNLHASIKIVKL